MTYTLDLFTSDLMADQLTSVTIGFEGRDIHEYTWNPVDLPLKNRSGLVNRLTIGDEFALQVYGMPVPVIFLVDEMTVSQKQRRKTLRLAPLSKVLKDFTCGTVLFQEFTDNDYHLYEPRMDDIRPILNRSFRRTDPVAQQTTDLRDRYDLNWTIRGDILEPEELTLDVTIQNKQSPRIVSDVMVRDYSLWSLDGTITLVDSQGAEQTFEPGLYLEYPYASSPLFGQDNVFYLSAGGVYEARGVWKKFYDMDYFTRIARKEIGEVDWWQDAAWQAYIDDRFQDEEGSTYHGAEKRVYTVTEVSSYAYETLGFWAVINYNVDLWKYRVIDEGDETAGIPDEPPRGRWYLDTSAESSQIVYSRRFLNHYVQADYVDASAADVWNDMARLSGAFWYMDHRTVVMETRTPPQKSNMIEIPGKSILEWDITVTKRREEDYLPSDDLTININLRDRIVAEMDAIYSQYPNEHRLTLSRHPDATLRPGSWIKSGDTRIGLVREITYHRDRRVDIRAIGGGL